MSEASRHLVLHGAIVLLFGLLLGAPYARSIQRGADAHVVNAWRVAHLSLPIGATLMFSVAALMPSLDISQALGWAIAGALIVSAYGFCLSTPLAAISGDRGLSSKSAGLGRLVYVGNMLGAIGSVAAAGALLFAALTSIQVG